MSGDRDPSRGNKRNNNSQRIRPSNIGAGIGSNSLDWKPISFSESEQNNYHGEQISDTYNIMESIEKDPWYTRNYKLWGYPNKRWFTSPILLGSGIIIIIVLSLLILPVLNLMPLSYPFSDQNTKFEKDQPLTLSQYLFDSAYLNSESSISYTVSSSTPVSFAIWNKPFTGIINSSKRNFGTYSDSFYVSAWNSRSMSFFLLKGDTLSYTISCSQFLQLSILGIAYGHYSNTSFLFETTGIFSAPKTDNWVFQLSTLGSPLNISINIQYNISFPDFSQANVNIVNSQKIGANTYHVPKNGTYYFYIYSTDLEQRSEVSYNVIFHNKLSPNETWKQLAPSLLILECLLGMIVVIAFYKRKKALEYEYNYNEEDLSVQLSNAKGDQIKCFNCGVIVNPLDNYCQNCGFEFNNDND